ncbi:MAG: sortase [Clostridiales bacterium]|nr:sortase [Clostridiales bacterium]
MAGVNKLRLIKALKDKRRLIAIGMFILGCLIAAYPISLKIKSTITQNKKVAELKDSFKKSESKKENGEKEYPVWHQWPETIIEIPEISVEATVTTMEDKDIFNENASYPPAHYKGTAFPGENGNVAIAGHRTGPADYFKNLDKLKENDVILLKTAKANYEYVVEKVFVVDKNDWSVVGNTDYPCLTLTTCEAEGFVSHAKRLIVRAKLNKVKVI